MCVQNQSGGDWDDGRDLLSTIITDWWFKCARLAPPPRAPIALIGGAAARRCASQQFANAVARAGTPAYVYRYQHVFSGAAIFVKFGIPAVCMNRTCHATVRLGAERAQ